MGREAVTKQAVIEPLLILANWQEWVFLIEEIF